MAEARAKAEAEAEKLAAAPHPKPAGRAPKGKQWDETKGEWVDKEGAAHTERGPVILSTGGFGADFFGAFRFGDGARSFTGGGDGAAADFLSSRPFLRGASSSASSSSSTRSSRSSSAAVRDGAAARPRPITTSSSESLIVGAVCELIRAKLSGETTGS